MALDPMPPPDFPWGPMIFAVPDTALGSVLRRRARTAVFGAAWLLALAPPAVAPAAGPTLAPTTDSIAAENALPGNPASEWDVVGNGDPALQGFATDISVNHGATIQFKVSTTATDYRIDIYRMGYYGGMGARRVATVQPSVPLPQSQPTCVIDNPTRCADCGNWAVSASWNVPANAVSGIYIAKLVREDPEDGRSSHIIFVVRDDESHSQLFFQTSDATWAAYNVYPNFSLYTVPRAYKASYNRPLVNRTQKPWDTVFNAEYPMVRWLERNGYDVSYTTDLDSDRRGAEILEHQVFLSVGHDEYWSQGQRAAVEAARAAGVHLAFFSGNETYWKTRWEPSLDGQATPYRTLVCYKETQAGAKIDPLPDVWTGQWRDCSFSPPADGCRPENALSGQMSWTTTLCNGSVCGIQVPATFAPMRLWRNTGIATLPTGAVAALPPATLGFEWDYEQFAASAPPGLVWLSSTTASGLTHHVSLYRHPSGALVFGAGTIQWSWGLDDHHTLGRWPPFAGSAPDVRMQQATVNVLGEMGVTAASLQNDLVAAFPSGDTTPPVSTLLAPAAGDSLLSGPVAIQGSAMDAAGAVGAVEVSVDGGLTWRRAQGLENWSYLWDAPPHAGNVTLRCRATDDLGNLETPGAGITLNVGGPPVELMSVGAAETIVQNGVDTAHFTILTKSNGGAATGLAIHVVVLSNHGDSFDLGTENFTLAAKASHSSPFSWPVPPVAYPWELSVRADLARDGQPIASLTQKAACTGMVMSHPDLQTALGQLQPPTGCLTPPTPCDATILGAVPHFGTLAQFVPAVSGLCAGAASFNAAHLLPAGTATLAALTRMIDPLLASLLQTSPVSDAVPVTVVNAMQCQIARVQQALTALPAGARIDSLASAVQSTFAAAGRTYSNELFVRGPANLKIGREGHWTSTTTLDLRDAYVFDAGGALQWGHAGPEPRRLGASSPNPHASAEIELRATGPGTIDFGFLHRGANGVVQWIRFAPIPVTATTVFREVVSDDLLYPWGFALFEDFQSDGIMDEILYPGGLRPSDVAGGPSIPRFRLLPARPNPFNPSTLVSYELPASGPVAVRIQDVRGRVLRTLEEGVVAAGPHQVEWNGRRDDGRAVASGMYFVHIVSPWGNATQKLTLLK